MTDSRDGVPSLVGEDESFWLGEPGQDTAYHPLAALPRAFKTALVDSGVHEYLAQIGVPLDALPDDSLTLSTIVADEFGRTRRLDIPHLMVKQFSRAFSNDIAYERAGRRWHRTPDRIDGLVPGDAGSIRWRIAEPLMTPFVYEAAPAEVTDPRVCSAVASVSAYLSLPFFIPANRAVEVVTATPPAQAKRPEIRLPARNTMVFHDAIPLSVVVGDDDTIDAYERGEASLRPDVVHVLGAVLIGAEDLALTDLQFLILSSRRKDQPNAWVPVPLPLNTGAGAADIVWNYAALLAWENWKTPPAVPRPRERDSSRAHLRSIARSKEGRDGAYHKVRVLDYLPPMLGSDKKKGPGKGKELQYRHKRRSYWKHNIRVGIRDQRGRFVGPVYKDGAIEGVTFERRSRFIPKRIVREDLPPKPGSDGEVTVYRIPDTIQRREGGSR